MNAKTIVEIIVWTIMAAIAVLVIMNARKFAVAISSPLTFWERETSMFTGSSYNKPNYGRAA